MLLENTGNKAVWVTWEYQRRNISMANAVGAGLVQLTHSGGRLIRYAVLSGRTLREFVRHRPRVIFFQNPSIVLSLLVVFVKALTLGRVKVIGDFHNAGVFPARGKLFCRFIARFSDAIIVSNENLARYVRSAWGGVHCFVVPDPIPAIHLPGERAEAQPVENPSPRQYRVVFICSWADDEPIGNVIGAAEQLRSAGRNVSVAITGRPKLEKYWPGKTLPSNVELTGYISNADFESLLGASDIIVDLTTRDDCMVCGAYEAVAVGRPVVLSNNQPTRDYFNKGAAFTDNTVEGIAQAIQTLMDDYERYKGDILSLKNQLLHSDSVAINKLKGAVGI